MDQSKNISIKLSAGFNLDEFTISQVAERHGYNNQPNEQQIDNLTQLCVNVLQPLREIIQVPIFITSGFRSFDVNISLDHLPFDQLIYEFGKWIHVSWNGKLNRKEALLSKFVNRKTMYERIGEKGIRC
jgi:hypothetical protein